MLGLLNLLSEVKKKFEDYNQEKKSQRNYQILRLIFFFLWFPGTLFIPSFFSGLLGYGGVVATVIFFVWFLSFLLLFIFTMTKAHRLKYEENIFMELYAAFDNLERYLTRRRKVWQKNAIKHLKNVLWYIQLIESASKKSQLFEKEFAHYFGHLAKILREKILPWTASESEDDVKRVQLFIRQLCSDFSTPDFKDIEEFSLRLEGFPPPPPIMEKSVVRTFFDRFMKTRFGPLFVYLSLGYGLVLQLLFSSWLVKAKISFYGFVTTFPLF